ncbi:MAG: hypothetical protein HYU64_07430 [Armatimonadetes bacterium]|nr:hypothetical protein [Armatimonadota bacterium]
MQFVSVRDLRIRPGAVWQSLKKGKELILTSRGKPFALMVETDELHLEQLLTEWRRVQAKVAVSRVRERAQRLGLDQLSHEEIDKIVHKARSKRKR